MYQFKSLKVAKYFANIMIYIETCGRFGVNKYEAVKRLFDGKTYYVQELDALKSNQ